MLVYCIFVLYGCKLCVPIVWNAGAAALFLYGDIAIRSVSEVLEVSVVSVVPYAGRSAVAAELKIHRAVWRGCKGRGTVYLGVPFVLSWRCRGTVATLPVAVLISQDITCYHLRTVLLGKCLRVFRVVR